MLLGSRAVSRADSLAAFGAIETYNLAVPPLGIRYHRLELRLSGRHHV